MLGGCSAAAAALTIGCGGDDGSGEDSAAGSSSGPATGPATSGNPATDDGPVATDDGPPGGSTGGSAGSTGGDTTGDPSGGSTDDSGGGSTGMASACDGMIVATISGNHGHALEIPLADIEAGVEVTYDASGDAGHCHEVILTADDFATLRNGGVVTKYSCNGGDHQFILSCAAGAPDPVPPPECGGNGDMTGACN